MKSFKKIVVATIASFIVGQTAHAQNKIGVGGFSISGGGLMLVGTVSTLSLADKHPAMTYIGWGLIVVGLLVDGGDLIIGSAKADQTLGAADVWNSMVREAKILAAHPTLIQSDSAIANAALAFELSPAAVAQLTVDLDGAKTAAARSDVTKKYFPNGTSSGSQRQAVANLVALSRMG